MRQGKAALYFHNVFLEHDTGRPVECRERLSVPLTYLASRGHLAGFEEIKPQAAGVEDIARIHAGEYIEAVKNLSEAGGGWADADTFISKATYRAAIYAAGAACDAASAALTGRYSHALAFARPPGHHATRYAAKGFCIFNNIAIAAARLLAAGSVERLAILDFDVHHGNGTQAAFYRDGRVIFVSFHRWPFYPGTGAASETGEGPGEGLTINVPLDRDVSSRQYLDLWESVLQEKIEPFAPQAILVSAGFDLYRNDPIAGLNFEVADFQALGASIAGLSRKTGVPSVATIFEGGYDLDALPLCLEAYLAGVGAIELA